MKLRILLLVLLCTANCSHSSVLINSRLNEIADVADKSNDSTLGSMRIEQAREYIDKSFNQLHHLETKNWTEDRIYFDSLKRINFYLKDPRLNIILERLYWKLWETGFAKEEDAKDLYGYFLVHRQFEEAMALYKKLPSFLTESYMPILKIGGPGQQIPGPSLLHLGDLNKAELKPFPASTFTGVIILASPNCQYSLNALNDLQKNQNKELRSLKNTVVITPQQNIDYREMKKWNKAHPTLQFKMVYRESDFALFEFNSVPKFYFLKNGNVVFSFEGWSQTDKGLEKFKEGLSII